MTNRTTNRGQRVIWLLVLAAAVGLASLVYGLSSASARPDFPLLTVSYLFLLGISQTGVVFTAVMRLVRADWAKPWYRIAELATLAYAPFAVVGLLLIFFFGKADLFYWLSAPEDAHTSPWLDSGWLLARNLAAMLLFYAVATMYALTSLRADLANGAATPPVDHDAVEARLYLMSPIVLVCFVITNTFVAWDFAMMLIPHWHSTVFPIHFWFGNVFAGTAALIAVAAWMRRIDGGEHFGQHQIRSLGMTVTGFTLLWLYFFWAQFFVIWFGNLPHESEPIWRQMYGHYAPYFWAMLAGCFFLPFASLLFAPVKRSIAAMCVLALGINVGVWINKYLSIVPVFSPDDRMFDAFIDVAIAVGLLAGFLLALAALARRVPVYSNWEMQRVTD